MKQKTVEKIMKIYGWITFIVLIMGIPLQFLNFRMLNMEVEFSLMIPFLISCVVEMCLSIALIRCKKDSSLVGAMGCQVLYRMVTIIMNILSVSVLAFINLAIYISLLLFVVVNCVPKFSEYRVRINKLWFAPIIAMLVVSIIGFIIDLNNKLPGTLVESVQSAGTEVVAQTFSLTFGFFSSLLGILPYLLLNYWLYKSSKTEIETE